MAFGDDAAAAGNALVWDDLGPYFCGDAIADPVTGLVAAAAVLGALVAGGRWMLDVALARCAALVAGPCLDGSGVEPAPVPDPPYRGRARPLGADTEELLGALML